MAQLLAQLLIGISLAVSAYQDIRERAVMDIVWIPALIGAAYALYTTFPHLQFLLVKLAVIGGIPLLFAYFGLVGQADAIALAFVAADPYELSALVPFVAMAVVAMVHIGYEYAIGNARGTKTITMDRFLKEKNWIPEATIVDGVREVVNRDVNVARDQVEAREPRGMVEVKYGVPTVAYIGAGYIIYIILLIAFNHASLLSLP